MAAANPLWGAPRIHGELLKLEIAISQATVAKNMPKRRRPPPQTCRTFLANHLNQIAAADFFVVPTAACRLLFVLVILAHGRRRVVHTAVTAHPTAAWTAQQFRNAFPWNQAHGISFAIAISRFTRSPRPRRPRAGMEEVLTAPHSPWQTRSRKTRPNRAVTPGDHGRVVPIPEVGGPHHRYESLGA
jgi:hypothetical protein